MIRSVAPSITIDAILDNSARLISPLRPWLDRVSAWIPDPLAPHHVGDLQRAGFTHDPFRDRLSS
jgi:hypothetical protein